jgi:hypothetical protein
VKPPSSIFLAVCAALFFILPSCGGKKGTEAAVVVENMYDDSISTSYTVALPDAKGEGVRITYTFFNMKRADTGNYKMTHVYLRHTGEEDTTIVNGTWKFTKTDSGNFVETWSGRRTKRFEYNGEWSLVTMNTDSMVADTGLLKFRQKEDNDLENSTVVMFGKVLFRDDQNAMFIDQSGDSLSVLKISAFPDLLALNDSVSLNSPQIKGVEVLATIQIRMSMDGRNVSRSLIVEKVRGVK